MKSGNALDPGGTKPVFIEAPMLHWRDTMFAYNDRGSILFSSNGLALHYARESMFSDFVDQAGLYQ
ncbi:MAG: hypothetical protein ACLTZ2_05325 [Desulfovibrio sp.]